MFGLQHTRSMALGALVGTNALFMTPGTGIAADDIVIDEFVGQWIALSLLPPTAAAGFASLWGWSPQHVALLGGSFLLFRLFDIWKPWPIRRLQRLPGGWGVMIDDVLAGACACLALHVALWIV